MRETPPVVAARLCGVPITSASRFHHPVCFWYRTWAEGEVRNSALARSISNEVSFLWLDKLTISPVILSSF